MFLNKILVINIRLSLCFVCIKGIWRKKNPMVKNKSLNLVRTGYKIHILHYLIKDCHTNILLKIQYILAHLITSQ